MTGVGFIDCKNEASCLQQRYYKGYSVHSGLERARYDLVFGTEWRGSDRR